MHQRSTDQEATTHRQLTQAAMTREESFSSMRASAKRPARVGRLLRQIARSLEGGASGSVLVQARLTGPSADAWRGVVLAAKKVGIEDHERLVAALLYGGMKLLRSYLKQMNQSTGLT